MSKFTAALKELKSRPRVPQTIRFNAIFNYNRLDSKRDPEAIIFDSFEELVLTYKQARHRRANADRPTQCLYFAELTDFGREQCAADPETYERHKDILANVRSL